MAPAVKISTSACLLQIQVLLEIIIIIHPTVRTLITVRQISQNVIVMQFVQTRLVPISVPVNQVLQEMVLIVCISTTVSSESITAIPILLAWTQTAHKAVFAYQGTQEMAGNVMISTNVPKTFLAAAKTRNVWTHWDLTNVNATRVSNSTGLPVNHVTAACQTWIATQTRIVQN